MISASRQQDTTHACGGAGARKLELSLGSVQQLAYLSLRARECNRPTEKQKLLLGRTTTRAQ
jgi:hypothetical protein